MSQRAEIIFELEETVVIRQGGEIVKDLCPKCRTNVDMVSPEILAQVAGTAERQIFRSIEAGEIHFIEADRILACVGCYRRLLGENRVENHKNQAVINDPRNVGIEGEEKNEK